MTAIIHQFARNAHEAFVAWHSLEQQIHRDPALRTDLNHLDRRIAAKERYFELVGRGR